MSVVKGAPVGPTPGWDGVVDGVAPSEDHHQIVCLGRSVALVHTKFLSEVMALRTARMHETRRVLRKCMPVAVAFDDIPQLLPILVRSVRYDEGERA